MQKLLGRVFWSQKAREKDKEKERLFGGRAVVQVEVLAEHRDLAWSVGDEIQSFALVGRGV